MTDYQGNILIKNPATPTGPFETGSAPGIWRLQEAMAFKRLDIWPTQGIKANDPYYKFVSLLLSTTSLGNANNNLFVDSSGAFNPISRNGNATQGSATPYSANWSNYFDGNGDYLSFSATSALNQSGDFTVEAWIYLTATPSAATPIYAIEVTNFMKFGVNTSRNLLVDQANVGVKVTGSTALNLNTWYHIAFVRSGSSTNNCKIYLNGVQEGQFTDTSTATASGTGRICSRSDNTSGFLTCYLSNLRVTNTAVYTSAFTPPTSALTAISGTQLLTCQSNRFRDASTNNFTITSNGDTRVTDFSPFSPGSPGITYNQNDITNWSGYFDGSGDYLQMPSNAAFAFGTGDYTIEGWIYVTVGGLDQRITWFSDDRHNIDINTSNQIFLYDGAIRTFGTVTVGTWNHFAVSRTGGTVSCYLNGVRGYNASETTNSSTRSMNIAANNAGNGYFNGYISNIRVVKGTGVYSGATITVPTTPLTAISGTSLLTLQNAAFTDNSTNNFVITQNGNVTVTGNSPFNTVGYWSNYFNGSTDYLTIGSSSNLALGSGDFTVECWMNPSSTPSQNIIFDWRASNNNNLVLYLSSGTPIWRVNTASAITGTAITTNTWTHLAVCRSGSTTTMYINGTSVGSFSDSNNYLNEGLKIGKAWDNNYWGGFLSNARIVKGTAVYTSNFTPPTTPLAAITNTQLLTCQNGRFIDNSTNAFTITANGNTSVQSFDPFYTATIASNGGSMYFDGSGDYLLTPYSGNTIFGSANFTFEAWIYPTTTSANCTIAALNNTTSGGAYCGVRIDYAGSTQNAFMLISNAANNWQIISGTSSNTVRANSWSHIAVVRNGSSFTLYVNGVSSATGTHSGSIHNYGAGDYIGAAWNGSAIEQPFFGYISNLRLVKGTAVYTSAFTPPTAPVTPTAATTLLVNGMNAGIYDATAINDMETVSNVYASTAVSKFGGSSIRFNGADYLKLPSNAELAFGTGDFTIEAWVYVTSLSGDWFIVSAIGSGGLFFGQRGGSGWGYGRNAVAWDYNSGTNPVANTWQHIAISRSGTNMRMFVDGVQIGTTQSSSTDYSLATGGTSVGSQGASYYFAGYMDDLRITKGYARYTANFTPPDKAFTVY